LFTPKITSSTINTNTKRCIVNMAWLT
jgi:hypothetical protein